MAIGRQTRRGLAPRRDWHPGRHRFCLLRRIRHSPRSKQQVFHLSREGKLPCVHRSARVADRFSVQGCAIGRHAVGRQIASSRRSRVCDLGFSGMPIARRMARLAIAVPAEPVDDFIRKGGALEETQGRECVCNGLLATIGLAQMNSNRISGSRWLPPAMKSRSRAFSATGTRFLYRCRSRPTPAGQNDDNARASLIHSASWQICLEQNCALVSKRVLKKFR